MVIWFFTTLLVIVVLIYIMWTTCYADLLIIL